LIETYHLCIAKPYVMLNRHSMALTMPIKAKNKEHRRKINNQSITEFIDNGISTDIAKKIITIIAKNLITNITINY